VPLDGDDAKPRLSPASIRDRRLRQALADIRRIAADYDATLEEVLAVDRSDPASVELGRQVPAIRVKDANLLMLAANIESDVIALGRAGRLRYLLELHVSPDGRAKVDLQQLVLR
jgi:hypothetical protein